MTPKLGFCKSTFYPRYFFDVIGGASGNARISAVVVSGALGGSMGEIPLKTDFEGFAIRYTKLPWNERYY